MKAVFAIVMLLLAAFGHGARAEPSPPKVAELIAANPLAPFAGVWVGEVATEQVRYTLRLTISAGNKPIDGSDFRSFFLEVLEPADRRAHTGFAHRFKKGEDGLLQADLVGPYHDDLIGLFHAASGTGFAKSLRLDADGQGFSLTWFAGGKASPGRFRRVTPLVQSAAIPVFVESSLTKKGLEGGHWAVLRERGNWAFMGPSPPLIVGIAGRDLPPYAERRVITTLGIVRIDDPLMELHDVSKGAEGSVDLRFHLWPGIRPGRKTLTFAWGQTISFDLRIAGMEGNPPRPRPEILAAVAVDPPKPYPTGSAHTRIVFVAGRVLPATIAASGLSTVISDEETIAYDIYRTPDEAGASPREFARGWELTGLSPGDGVEALLLLATIRDGALPSQVGFRLDEAPGSWRLDFAHDQGPLAIVRPLRRGEWETTSSVIMGERFAAEIRLPAGVRRGGLRMLIAAMKDGKLAAAEREIIASPDKSAGGFTLYRTPSLKLGPLDASGNEAPFPPADLLAAAPGGTLVVRLAESETAIADPPVAGARIINNPTDLGATWDRYLETASACAGLTLEQGRTSLDRKVDYAWNWLFTFDFREYADNAGLRFADITLGDHAAALLLQNAFLARMETIRADYQRILDNPAALRGFRLTFAKERHNDRLPLNWIKVKTPAGKTMALSEIDSADRYAPDLSPAARILWQDAQMKAGLIEFTRQMDATIATARNVKPCQAAELVQISGFAFDSIVESVLPTLMKERLGESGAKEWAPDMVARSHVATLSIVGDQIRDYEAYARMSRKLTSIVISAPASFAAARWLATETLWATLFQAASAAADIGGSLAELAAFARARDEFAFAQGATEAIGTDRLDAVAADANDWIGAAWAALGVAKPAAFAGWSRMNASAKARAAAELSRAAARGERHAAALANETINQLTPAQRSDLAAYVVTLRAKQVSEGTAALSVSERKALQALETLKSIRPNPVNVATVTRPRPVQPAEGLPLGEPVGGLESVVPARLLGRGGYNEVYEVAGRPSVVLRVRRGVNAEAEAYESYGRAALENPANGFDPAVVRVARIERAGELGAEAGSYAGRRFELVERMRQGSAFEQLAGRPMSPGQAIAFNRAARALNDKGYAWMDCHTGNFSFVKGAGADEWSVVIIDPAGIVPARITATATAAQNARAMQRIMSALDPDILARNQALRQQRATVSAIADPSVREAALERLAVLEKELASQSMARIAAKTDGLVDYQRLGLGKSENGVPFVALSMVDHDTARLLDAYADPALAYDALRRGRPLPKPRRHRRSLRARLRRKSAALPKPGRRPMLRRL